MTTKHIYKIIIKTNEETILYLVNNYNNIEEMRRFNVVTDDNINSHINDITTLSIESCNNLYLDKSLNEDYFSRFNKLNKLTIHFCSNIDKFINFFKTNINLNFIVIANNKLQKLNDDLFSNYINLEKILLERNTLTIATINNNLFNNNLKLKHVNLSCNNLVSIDKDTFKYNIELEHMYFEVNKLTSVDKDLFKYNINVKYISLKSNNITEIDKDLFSNNIDLVYIDLKDNNITEIDKKLFSNNISLEYINLSNNKLLSIDNVLFSNNIKLQKLYISHNKLETIGLSIFNNNRNMKELYISSNNLKLLPTNLKSLEFLDAEDNPLITLSNIDFSDLKKCNISRTNISRIEFKNGIRLSELKYICLDKKDECKIKYIDPLLKDYVYFVKNMLFFH
jgi:hypothetical protein